MRPAVLSLHNLPRGDFLACRNLAIDMPFRPLIDPYTHRSALGKAYLIRLDLHALDLTSDPTSLLHISRRYSGRTHSDTGASLFTHDSFLLLFNVLGPNLHSLLSISGNVYLISCLFLWLFVHSPDHEVARPAISNIRNGLSFFFFSWPNRCHSA